jgi:SAM-dependent methyltransferase
VSVIPFYGVERPDLFAIERKAMDRPGLVIKALGERLPSTGLVMDIGAGDGYTAERLTTISRSIVAVEPLAGMIRKDRALQWVRAEAEHLPFSDGAFDGAYATWAYFFSRGWDPRPGLAELHRVVMEGGPLLVAENLGDDEFCELAQTDISADPDFWAREGFTCYPIDTWFRFDDIEESRELLAWYFGEAGLNRAKVKVRFRVGLFAARSRGPWAIG